MCLSLKQQKRSAVKGTFYADEVDEQCVVLLMYMWIITFCKYIWLII